MRKFDRKEMRDELMKRTQESYERKEGDSYNKYFKEEENLDIILAKFGPTKDEPHIIDIIPFYAGNKMPDPMRIKEGKPAYYLDVYVHQNIGPGKQWIVCPTKNWGEPCPVCEYIDELVKEGKEYDDFSDIYPKRRCVYNIIDQSSIKEAKKGIQVWEASHKYSEKPIQSAAKNPRGGGIISFAHPDKSIGQSISFSVDNDTYRTISGHKLVPRDYDIEDSIMEKAFQLDQIIKILTYKEISKILNSKGSAEEPEEGSEELGSGDDGATAAADDKKPRGGGKNQCPANGIFGEEIDTCPDCGDCSVYTECATRADEIEEEKKKARADKVRASRRERA